MRSKILLPLGKDAANTVKHLLIASYPLVVDGLVRSEMLVQMPPYSGTVVGELNGVELNLALEVFNLKHPSFVEGPLRDGDYVRNLQTIKHSLL